MPSNPTEAGSGTATVAPIVSVSVAVLFNGVESTPEGETVAVLLIDPNGQVAKRGSERESNRPTQTEADILQDVTGAAIGEATRCPDGTACS